MLRSVFFLHLGILHLPLLYAHVLAQAVADATTAASMEPALAAAHLWRANGHLKLDQFQEAIDHYNIALRLYGENHVAAVLPSSFFNC